MGATFQVERVLDPVGRKLLRAMQENARLSFSELGRRVGLSAPAVAERVRKLKELEIITGYHAEVNPAHLGYGVLAFNRLTTPTDKYPRVLPQVAQRLPEIRECHHVTGGEAFIMKVLATSIPHLESLIAQLSAYGATSTSMPDTAGARCRVVVAGEEAGIGTGQLADKLTASTHHLAGRSSYPAPQSVLQAIYLV